MLTLPIRADFASAPASGPRTKPCRTAAQRHLRCATHTVDGVVFLHWASQCSCSHGTEITDPTAGRLDLERLFSFYFALHKSDCSVLRARLVPKAARLF